MQTLVSALQKSSVFQRLKTELERQTWQVTVEGVVKGASAPLLAAVVEQIARPLLVIAPTPAIAQTLMVDLEVLLSETSRLHSFTCGSGLLSGADVGVTRERLIAVEALYRHSRHSTHADNGGTRRLSPLSKREEPILVTSIAALCRPTVPPKAFQRCRFSLSVGSQMEAEEILERLLAGGYQRVQQVTTPGEFSQRGGILDVFSPAHDAPFRIELFGDLVESLRSFDVETQRSQQVVEEVVILPAREFVLPVDEVNKVVEEKVVEEIEHRLKLQLVSLRQAGRKEQARLLQEQVERDLWRIRQLQYFEGVDWYFPFAYPKLPWLFDHLPKDACLVLVEPKELEVQHGQVLAAWEELMDSLVATGDLLNLPRTPLLSFEEFSDYTQRFQSLSFTLESETSHLTLSTPDSRAYPETRDAKPISIPTHHIEAFESQPRRLVRRLQEWRERKWAIAIATRFPDRVVEMLRDFESQMQTPQPLSFTLAVGRETGGTGDVGLTAPLQLQPGLVTIFDRTLSAGFICPEAGLVLVTDCETFGTTFMKRRRRRIRAAVPITAYTDLKQGDYVVHIHHGIGLYRGVVRQRVLGAESDYLCIEYAGGDSLYVPVHQIDRIQKYVGSDAHEPTLSSLSSSRWSKAKQRVKKRTEEIAKELVEIYARRETEPGHPFAPDTPWQREVEEAFPYEETEDQLRAVNDVKGDMHSPKPMDRLVCGDVGFGKTEVALRAAFKAVMDGKQVAMLVPTTVLAQQHVNTFKERLVPYPVRVEMLSRFLSPKEQKQVLEGLRVGSVDIVIGTHRLLSEDVNFRSLGLLIVDEEQRFGVKQKERLKRLRTSVDVLTLTATPIPRTLHMALGDLREMSLINDPPEGRRAVKTYMSQYDEDLVRYAILRELERGGQVYYVFNRVQGIEHVAEKVRRLVPTARIAIGHGQMLEEELERVMMDFFQHRFDVLVCTTIIENGLDVANANTLIVERCEKFGLAQLYQLRGRVGRSERQAYAYFFHAHPLRLSHQARMRLEAIREFTDLGSGFRLALRDLEIRGAGNLLGVEQHGFINEVGFDLYMQMLSEAVAQLRGEVVTPKMELPQADLPVSAFIPEDYIEDIEQRLHIYRKMALVQSEEDVKDIEAELKDRFGQLPEQVRHLLSILRIRLLARQAAVSYIAHDNKFVIIRFYGVRQLPDFALVRLYTQLRKGHSAHTLEAIQLRRDHVTIEYGFLSTRTLLRLIEDLLALLSETPPVVPGEE